MKQLNWRISAGAAGAALLLATGAVAAVPASAASRAGAVTCPTVNPKTGAVTPAPAPSVDWSGCDLTGANLTGASLLLADLSGTNFTKANLTKANFDSADLSGANLTKANLTHVWLGGTNSTGAKFTDAAGVGAAFTSATLTDANFTGVKLPSALLAFTNLTSAILARADLEHADFSWGSSTKTDFTGANLTYANFNSAGFGEASLEDANLAHANVTGVGLAGAHLAGATSGGLAGIPASLPTGFSDTGGYLVGPYANLAGAHLAGAFAVNDSFAHVNLTKASLADADLASADFGSANLAGASLKGADLSGAELTATTATLKNVTWSAATTCPDGRAATATVGCFAKPAIAHPPVIKVSLRRGVPGTTLSLDGGGFAGNETLTISIGNTKLATAKTTGKGSVGPVALIIPASAQPGLHQITATGKSKGQSAAAWFTVATDWDQAGFDSGLSGDNPIENTITPAKAPALAKKFIFNPGTGAIGAFPASIDDGAAFVASAKGPLTAINAAAGKTLWTWQEPTTWTATHTNPHLQLGQPVVADGTAYLSIPNQGIVAVSSGQLLWQQNGEPLPGDEYPAEVAVDLSRPTLANGVLYAVEDDFVFALDAASGVQVWWNAPVPWQNLAPQDDPQCGQPAVVAGVVYMSCNNGYVYALNAASGANLWSYAVPGSPALGSTVVSGGTIYVTTSAAGVDELIAISASTNAAQEWSFKAPGPVVAPAIAGGVVYAAAGNGVLYALNAATGTVRWSKQLHDRAGESDTHGVAVADGVVYTLNAKGVAYAFNAKTGAQLWSYQAGSTLQATPVIVNGILYIGTRTGGVEAFAAK
jgi:uncharacterized protein YjbI with pentapeptide repeats/outer membrane protein assembly factor BamB